MLAYAVNVHGINTEIHPANQAALLGTEFAPLLDEAWGSVAKLTAVDKNVGATECNALFAKFKHGIEKYNSKVKAVINPELEGKQLLLLTNAELTVEEVLIFVCFDLIFNLLSLHPQVIALRLYSGACC